MSDIPGLVEALEPVARFFQTMKINFYISGSVASSFHGASRSTLDVDLVADLKSKDIDHFVSSLKDEYYVSKLEWYRMGNEVSERQWEDVTRVMKILGDQADLEYLRRNAVELNVSDLLKKLFDPPTSQQKQK